MPGEIDFDKVNKPAATAARGKARAPEPAPDDGTPGSPPDGAAREAGAPAPVAVAPPEQGTVDAPTPATWGPGIPARLPLPVMGFGDLSNRATQGSLVVEAWIQRGGKPAQLVNEVEELVKTLRVNQMLP